MTNMTNKRVIKNITNSQTQCGSVSLSSFHFEKYKKARKTARLENLFLNSSSTC